MTEETKRVRAIDVIPYCWAVWCRIEDGEPFANTIMSMSWSEDGSKIWFCLDSHNFLSAQPDEELELMPVAVSDDSRRRGEDGRTRFLGNRPTEEVAQLRRQKKEIEERLAALSAERRDKDGTP